MTKFRLLAPLAIVLSALLLSACQSGTASDHRGKQSSYGWDGARGGGP